jgi:hypothetical protein
LTVVVRGIGDVGSAVAHRLFLEGYAVVIHDVPTPTTTRRGMAFADAVFDGSAILDNVHAVRAHDLLRIMEALASRRAIPVYVRDLSLCSQRSVPRSLWTRGCASTKSPKYNSAWPKSLSDSGPVWLPVATATSS